MNMTGSNLVKLLVVVTLAAKRLDLCKDTRDPSGEIFCQESYLVILLK
jgi:hypothetical protein